MAINVTSALGTDTVRGYPVFDPANKKAYIQATLLAGGNNIAAGEAATPIYTALVSPYFYGNPQSDAFQPTSMKRDDYPEPFFGGIANMAITAGNRGWFQVFGKYVNAKVETGVVAGDILCYSGQGKLRPIDFSGTDFFLNVERLFPTRQITMPGLRALALTSESSNLADIFIF